MDFWCTVIVARVLFKNDTVIWEKIGLVKNDNFSVKQWRESGIQDIGKWSERDWKLYGNTLSFLKVNDIAWEEWWSEHWKDEETRRLWNYFHKYFNDDDNIQWIDGESLIFSSFDYDKCISNFKQFKY